MKPKNFFSGRIQQRFSVFLSTLAFTSTPLLAQTNLLKLDYQWADSLAGPWTKPSANQTYVQQDGSMLTLADAPQKYFRLMIEEIDFDGVETPSVPVVELRQDTVRIALTHLKWLLASHANESSGSWSNATLAPMAYKVFDPAHQNGEEPAYIEFKIISDDQPTEKPAEFLEGNEFESVCELGHVLVSLHEGDAPVPEFSESGPTPCERLLRRLGSASSVKIMRFGPSFWTVENALGELLVNAGSDPFRVPHEFVEFKDQTFMGEFDSETAEQPPADGYGGPKMTAQSYENYAAFKEDYLANPVYRLLRQRKAEKVAAEWALLRGETLPRPAVLTANPGEELLILPGEKITRVFFDDDGLEEQPVAAININPSGGLIIQGLQEGFGELTVETTTGLKKFEFVVPPLPEDDFEPGWQEPQYWWVSEDYSITPRYKQTKDYNLWCPKVGCGPVAWAMLLGYWDRDGNVPAAFYRNIPGDFTITDAPYTVDANPTHLHDVYALLHDYCDVWCLPEGSGASMPGDMIEGGPTYLWVPKVFGYLGYKYSWAWNLTDPDWNEPSNRIRKAIKNGRPAIIGLNWLEHYGVAYGYKYQEFKSDPNTVLFRRRWFKVNQGWNKADGQWYSGDNTFLGASIKAWQKTP